MSFASEEGDPLATNTIAPRDPTAAANLWTATLTGGVYPGQINIGGAAGGAVRIQPTAAVGTAAVPAGTQTVLNAANAAAATAGGVTACHGLRVDPSWDASAAAASSFAAARVTGTYTSPAGVIIGVGARGVHVTAPVVTVGAGGTVDAVEGLRVDGGAPQANVSNARAIYQATATATSQFEGPIQHLKPAATFWTLAGWTSGNGLATTPAPALNVLTERMDPCGQWDTPSAGQLRFQDPAGLSPVAGNVWYAIGWSISAQAATTAGSITYSIQQDPATGVFASLPGCDMIMTYGFLEQGTVHAVVQPQNGYKYRILLTGANDLVDVFIRAGQASIVPLP